jgi:putative PIN family toxin of toxin-antitoxin system
VLRLVCDTNIYISALAFDGLPEQLLRQTELGRFNLYGSAPIFKELKIVLQSKFGWSKTEIDTAFHKLGKFVKQVRPGKKLHVLDDEPDNRILECAIAAGADLIISGDQPLLRLRQFQGVRLLSLREFINEYPLTQVV